MNRNVINKIIDKYYKNKWLKKMKILNQEYYKLKSCDSFNNSWWIDNGLYIKYKISFDKKLNASIYKNKQYNYRKLNEERDIHKDIYKVMQLYDRYDNYIGYLSKNYY